MRAIGSLLQGQIIRMTHLKRIFLFHEMRKWINFPGDEIKTCKEMAHISSKCCLKTLGEKHLPANFKILFLCQLPHSNPKPRSFEKQI